MSIGCNFLALFAHLNNWPSAVTTIFSIFGSMIGILGPPGMLYAIACGHVALHLAKRYTKPYTRRGMAIVSLIIGYLNLTFFLGVITIFLIAGFNGF